MLERNQVILFDRFLPACDYIKLNTMKPNAKSNPMIASTKKSY